MIGTTTSAPSASVPAGLLGPGGRMGKEEFLQLLVTQLRFQDPLNPMKPDEFAAQLAQFSSVEQLMQINTALADQAALTELSIQYTNASAALSVVGRSVLANGDGLIVAEGSTETAVTFDIAGAAQTKIRVFDEAGAEVMSAVQMLEGGRNTVALDTSALPAGSYRYTVEATGAGNAPVPSRTFTTGRVDGVRYDATGPVLLIGGAPYTLSSVLEIRA